MIVVAAAGVQVEHVVGVRRELARRPASAYIGKLLSWIDRRHQRRAVATIVSTRSTVRPVPCSMQSMPASTSHGSTVSPKQWAVTRAPCSWAVAMRGGERVGRERRSEVAVVAGDPVADQLHPAVAALRLLGDVRRERPRARSRGRSCGCSAGCARCGGPRGSAGAGRRAPGPIGCRPASRSRAGAARRRRGRRGPAAPSWPRPPRRARRARCGSGRRPARGRSTPPPRSPPRRPARG